MRASTTLVAVWAVVACRAPEELSSQPAVAYFEPGVLCPEFPEIDDHLREFSSRALTAMNEPSLLPSCRRGERVCRFLWLRSFDVPIAVRLEESNEGWTGTVTVLADGAGSGADEPRRLGPIAT